MDQQKHDEFAECLFRNQHRVFGYILALVPNRDDADEVFQQTCLTLWKNWERFDRSREFFPWACGFAHNQIRRYYRSNVGSRVQLDSRLPSQPAISSKAITTSRPFASASDDCRSGAAVRSKHSTVGSLFPRSLRNSIRLPTPFTNCCVAFGSCFVTVWSKGLLRRHRHERFGGMPGAGTTTGGGDR